MWRGLTFSQPRAAAARVVGRVERLDHDALVAGGERGVEERLRAAPSSATTARGTTRGAGHDAPRARVGALGAGPVEQVLAVEVQHVEEERRQRHAQPSARRVPKRLAVTWNGCGRPSARSAIASPSSTSAARPAARATACDDLGHARGDVVEAAGEDARRRRRRGGPGPRTPSSFHSTAAGPVRCQRGLDVGAGRGEHRLQRRGRPPAGRGERRRAARPAQRRRRRRGRRAASARGAPRRAARSAARATASTITPSSAPWRSSPMSSAREEALLARRWRAPNSVGQRVAPRRLRAGPGHRPDPLAARRRPRRASASPPRRAPAGPRSDGQPTPIWRWRSSPERYATPIATSSGAEPPQRLGEPLDLGRARRHLAHRFGGRGQLGEQHRR